jgi:predicted MFS family arabinose efflux permease
MNEQTSQRPLPWYFVPTVVIVAGCIVAMLNFGARSTMGQFTQPISEANQWPREIFSLAIALQNLIWGAATPVAGMLADRFGAARVLMVGAVFYALGFVVMYATNVPFLFHLGAGVVMGVGIALSSFGIVMAALGRIVPPEKRSWAFGIATASGSLGQFIFNPLTAVLITSYGWSTTLLILGASSLLIIPFAMPLLVQKPGTIAASAGETQLSMSQAIGKAFGHRSYILLTSGFFVCGFQIAFVTVHLPPYLKQNGISPEFAGIAMAAIGLFNVIGSYTAGIIGGRGEKRVPLSLIYLLRSIVVTIFILSPITPVTTLIFTCVLGVLWLSTVPFTMGLITVMFGTRYMATLYGFVFLSHQIGSFLGVWLGGKLFDIYGSYDPVWWMGVVLGLFAAAVHLPIREKRADGFASA